MPPSRLPSDDDSVDPWKDDAENALIKKKKELKRKREEEVWEREREKVRAKKKAREDTMAKIDNYYDFPAYALNGKKVDLKVLCKGKKLTLVVNIATQ